MSIFRRTGGPPEICPRAQNRESYDSGTEILSADLPVTLTARAQVPTETGSFSQSSEHTSRALRFWTIASAAEEVEIFQKVQVARPALSEEA